MTGPEQTEDTLRENLSMYKDLVSNIPSGVYRFRMKALGGWVFDFVSDRFCELTGLNREDVLNDCEEVFRLIHPDDRTTFISLNESVQKSLAPYMWEGRAIIDGETRWAHVESRSTLMANGDKVWSGYLTDITGRKRLEEERLEMERKLLQAQKIESLAVMAGGIAHDFNNQLAVVLGNLDLLLMDRTLDPESKLKIKEAVDAAKRSAELSRQMLIYSGSSLGFPADLDLKELLNRKASLLKFCVSKYVTLNLEIYSKLPFIKGDADQITRLVTNIMVNASEAIGDHDGEVTLRTGVMDCDASYLRGSRLEQTPEPGRFVFMEVTDTGCGMDAATVHKLFDPFFTTKFTGRGLGMAEVMGTVKGDRGAIMVESKVGKGTTIRVLFPASEKAEAPSAIDAVEPKAVVSDTSGRRKTILFVEDESGLRSLGVRRLELLGYDSITAVDGEECVRVFQERLNEIDLVMLDFKMPKMDGDEAFGELILIKPDVKVILSSGYTEDVVLESFPGPKPASILHKPYDMDDLKVELDRLLGTTGFSFPSQPKLN